jgi:hypothetical protein
MKLNSQDLEQITDLFNGPLVMAILFISMGSLCAQAQQPNTAKLKADA